VALGIVSRLRIQLLEIRLMTKLVAVFFGLLFSISTAAEVVSITMPSPTNGQVITDGCIPVYANAKSDIGSKITRWRVYVDGVSKYSIQDTSRIHTRICVPTVTTGPHTVKAKAWSETGVSGSSPSIDVTISNIFRIVAPKEEPLSPATKQSFTNGLIRVAAAVESPYQISAWVVYIDSVRVFTSYPGAPHVKKYFEVPVGMHKVTVKVWDVNGSMKSFTATDVWVVKDPMNTDTFVKAPSTAITFWNMDRQGALNWKTPKTGGAASCRGDDLACIAKAPIAIMNPVRFVANPSPLPVSSDGRSVLFETLAGTEPYGNALYGASSFDNDPSRDRFIWDMWVMTTSTNIQTLEIDLPSTVGGKTFMMGTQCNVAAGYWDFWDDTAQSATHPLPPHWQHVTPKPGNNNLICNPKPNQWMHLRFHFVRGDTTYRFMALEVDGVNHSLSELPESHPRARGWGDGTSLQIQLDSDYSATPFKLYIDKMNLTKW
jgi:hypothetical protein